MKCTKYILLLEHVHSTLTVVLNNSYKDQKDNLHKHLAINILIRHDYESKPTYWLIYAGVPLEPTAQ